eukprot:128917-Hanusia_phi.AAC.1
MEYSLIEYRQNDLVRLDVAVNGDAVDALSFILHRFSPPPSSSLLLLPIPSPSPNLPRPQLSSLLSLSFRPPPLSFIFHFSRSRSLLHDGASRLLLSMLSVIDLISSSPPLDLIASSPPLSGTMLTASAKSFASSSKRSFLARCSRLQLLPAIPTNHRPPALCLGFNSSLPSSISLWLADPQQVPIQAKIGEKIVASAQISAMRKDVSSPALAIVLVLAAPLARSSLLPPCHLSFLSALSPRLVVIAGAGAGQMLRRRHHKEEEAPEEAGPAVAAAEGKKRMKSVGSVDVPQEAFMAMLNVCPAPSPAAPSPSPAAPSPSPAGPLFPLPAPHCLPHVLVLTGEERRRQRVRRRHLIEWPREGGGWRLCPSLSVLGTDGPEVRGREQNKFRLFAATAPRPLPPSPPPTHYMVSPPSLPPSHSFVHSLFTFMSPRSRPK